MADSLSDRNPYIDLNTTNSARVIRSAGLVRVFGIRVNGVGGSDTGSVVLRRGSSGGSPVFSLLVGANQSVDGTQMFDPFGIMCTGLFMDSFTATWGSGSSMIIYTSDAP